MDQFDYMYILSDPSKRLIYTTMVRNTAQNPTYKQLSTLFLKV